MKRAIKTQVIITSLSAKKDGSLGLRMATPELTADEKVAFMELQNVNLDALFDPIDFATKEITEVKSEVDTKTPSQRLRSLWYVVWKEIGSEDEFNLFYLKKMEKIMDYIKEKYLDARL